MTREQEFKLILLRQQLETAQRQRAFYDILCQEALEDIQSFRKELKE